MRAPSATQVSGWTSDARAAIQANPDYFVWWYTAKSIATGVIGSVAAYYIGREAMRRELAGQAQTGRLAAHFRSSGR